MNQYLLYFLILVALFTLEFIFFRIADHFNIIDKPNEQSSHKSIVLRGGGVIFVLGACIYAIVSSFQYPWFLIGLTLIAAVSFVDDIHSQPDLMRLVVQFIAMFMMFYQLDILKLEAWWILIIAMIFCVGIINAFNFMDGINGITGGYSLAVLLPLLAVNCGMGTSTSPTFVDMRLLLIITLAVIVFCFFNFRKKAKCFAGDVGSISIAFIVVFATGALILATNDVTYIMFLAVYGVDACLTIVHRILLHENLGQAHRKHMYQLMANELKMPHTLVSLIYMAVQLLISASLLWLPVNHYWYSLVVLVVLCCVYLLFMKKYYHLHEEYLASLNHGN